MMCVTMLITRRYGGAGGEGADAWRHRWYSFMLSLSTVFRSDNNLRTINCARAEYFTSDEGVVVSGGWKGWVGEPCRWRAGGEGCVYMCGVRGAICRDEGGLETE